MLECNPQYAQTNYTLYTPVSAPQEQCAWCWPYIHPDASYPEQWSSTICTQHSLQVIEQRHRHSRRKRYTALQTVYTHLLHCSLPYYQYDKKQWQQKIQQLFQPTCDSTSPQRVIYTVAQQQGQQDGQRYRIKNGEQREPFSLVWERGHIAAGRFFRQTTPSIKDRTTHRDTFTYWYCVGYMQQVFFLLLGAKDGQTTTTYQILIGPARDSLAPPCAKPAAANADEHYQGVVVPAQNQPHILGGAL